MYNPQINQIKFNQDILIDDRPVRLKLPLYLFGIIASVPPKYVSTFTLPIINEVLIINILRDKFYDIPLRS